MGSFCLAKNLWFPANLPVLLVPHRNETAQSRKEWAARAWGPRKAVLFGVNHSPSCPLNNI